MQLRGRKTKLWSVSDKQMVRLSVILFFCNAMIEFLFSQVLKPFGLQSFKDIATAIVVYFPLFLALIMAPRRHFKADFVVLLFLLTSFFAISLLIHPEYLPWYQRKDYGVWNFVLFPTNGLYCYLFVRLESSEDELRKDLKIAGYFMYLYFFAQIYLALRRGYWFGIASLNNRAEFSYNISFGYNVLFFFSIYFQDALKKRKMMDIVMSVIGAVMVLSYGSRGATFCGAILLVLLFFTSETRSNRSTRRILLYVLSILLLILFYLFRSQIILFFSETLSRLNVNSRFLQKMLKGTLLSDSGRIGLWQRTLQMIGEKPFGYGAMGSQHVLANFIYVGYPHSIILEFLVDYGVLFGSILFIFVFKNALSMIIKRRTAWSRLFIPIVSVACSLFLSLTYWASKPFWTCVGIGVNAYFQQRKRKRKGGYQTMDTDEGDYHELENR